MLTLLPASIHCYNGAWEYQKVPKCIIWAPHVVPLPDLLLLIRVHYPCLNADTSSYLLVLVSKCTDNSISYSTIKTLFPLARVCSLWGPEPPTLQGPELKGWEAQISQCVTENDGKWSHSCFCPLVTRPMHSSCWEHGTIQRSIT